MPRRARSIRPCRTASARYDLDILVENVGFGLADLAAMQGRDDAADEAIEAAEAVRAATARSGTSSTTSRAVAGRPARDPGPGPPFNDLGFAVDEISLEPTADGPRRVRLRVAVANRRFHARELERLTGSVALEGQARLLLNDLHEYQAWLEYDERRALTDEEAAERWLREVLQPTLARHPAGHRVRARPRPGLLRRARAEVDPVGGWPAATSASRRRSTPISGSGRRRPRTGRRAAPIDPRHRLVLAASDTEIDLLDGERSPRRQRPPGSGR